MSNNKKSERKYNVLLTTILTTLYILLITKLGDIISTPDNSIRNNDLIEKTKLESYTWIVLFISIMGLIIAYFMLDKDTNKGNYIIRNSLTIGGVVMLLYVMFFYWDYLGDYSKLSLLGLSITAIIYYIYNS